MGNRDMSRITIYDTTLRDGAQGEGISFSPAGKVKLARIMDQFGIDYIEGGFAASNPKDRAFFSDIKKIDLRHAKIAAFGSTRRAGIAVAEDGGIQALVQVATPVCTLFGKSWRLHVRDVLRTTEDRAMIADTVSFLKRVGREVVYDAEHFFDGYKDSADHALATLRAAAEGGADFLVLCDTNGGALPHEVFGITEVVKAALGIPIGIHAHNDGGCGTANSLEAVRAGAVQVQGTMNGYGERCGNADLCDIIPNLMLKLNCDCLADGNLAQLKDVSELAHELANYRPDSKAPFVGDSAFAHKGGMHVDGVRKNPATFEHVDPKLVGNDRRILISELSGSSNVFFKAVEIGLDVHKDSPEIKEIRHELERQEKEGYAFEAAEASFQLLMRKVLNEYEPLFSLDGFCVIIEKRHPDEPCVSQATIKVKVGGEMAHTVAEADGPVDALNEALRRALTRFYPAIQDVVLTDYRVRILDPEEHTGAKTRVLIESTDGSETWGTVGVSENLIEASWEALVDSVEYKLYRDQRVEKKGDEGAE